MNRHYRILTIILLFFSAVSFAANKPFTLVIDAGHGGHDTGALGVISQEKNINLSVALAFGRLVERNCPDVKVIYTRKTDVFIPLMERANIANRNNADLFISVHTNALPQGKIARGFETYTLGMHRAKDNLDVAMRENSVISMEKGYKSTYEGFDPKSSESYIMFEFIQGHNMERSVQLAQMIQTAVCRDANRPDKGVHQAGFLVLRETSMPSCLIELGFITTPDEEEYLNTDDGVSRIAQGIFEAFQQYKNRYDRRITVPYKDQSPQEPQIPQIVPTDYSKKVSSQNRSVSKPVVAMSTTSSSRAISRATADNARNTRTFSKSVTPKATAVKDAPVFKVQLFMGSRKLRPGDQHFQGITDFECIQEGNLFRYTTGSSTNYNEINRLRKSLLEKFPDAFIIAYKNGEKMDVNAAIREFLANKRK
ncbi:N-acetylmuramoyl-L-alanine amidase [Prevotella sp. AGR2160]|uniref:N-acetylmuramoyl-L-alanine amidase family protein n=1 Tax=Prevotella sp. AGR2160 TaxID=1280674 RepID=UPI000490C63E|nr:N-acetylmuramoyl-L-alanine amidase [Prevotella sp. AGR2160]